MDYVLGYKRGMTQAYAGDTVVPVTVVEIPQNIICSARELDEDGFRHIDIGIGVKRKPSRAEEGKYAQAKTVPQTIWSVRVPADGVTVGKTYGAEVCTEGDRAFITCTTKAKGFMGVVKRWGFHGGPRTHGQSDRQRAPGAIAPGTDPGRVFKGTKMAGKMGGNCVTLRSRKIVKVGDDHILIKGSLPGNTGGVLKIHVTKHRED